MRINCWSWRIIFCSQGQFCEDNTSGGILGKTPHVPKTLGVSEKPLSFPLRSTLRRWKMNIKTEKNLQGMARVTRHAAPTHYTFRIQSFSLFSEYSIKSYESNAFESGGYKWKLVLYPSGREELNGKDHISLYLEIADTDALPSGWEVNVLPGLFLYDQLHDKYVTLEENGDRIRRFHAHKKEWGHPQLIPTATFKDPSNGYLVNDTCIFGADVFVCKNASLGECFSMISNPTTYYHTWNIEKFSELNAESYYSEVFYVGKHKCKIKIYPKGDTCEINNKFISGYLELEALESSSCKRIFLKYKLLARNQSDGTNIKVEGSDWFEHHQGGWGSRRFLDLKLLNSSGSGYFANDALIIDAEVAVIGSVSSST